MRKIIQALLKVLDPNRFIDGEKAGRLDVGRVWMSPTRVVEETFYESDQSQDAAQQSSNQNGGEHLDSVFVARQAVATDLTKPDARAHQTLIIKRPRVQAGSSVRWVVTLQNGHETVVKRVGEPAEMIALYKQLYAAMTKPVGPGRLKTWGVGTGLLAITIYVFLSVLGSLTGNPRSEDQNAKMAPQSAFPGVPGASYALTAQPQELALRSGQLFGSEAQAKAYNPADAMLTEEEKIMVSKANRIQLSQSGPELIVFSDPLCPFCRRLDGALSDIKDISKTMIIPVGFKDASREMIAQVFCSKDQTEAWRNAMLGMKFQQKPCASGYEMADQNNKLFEKLRLSATPTLVSPKGLLVESAASSEELKLFLQH